MKRILHILMKFKDQETSFGGESYPHYEIGWKSGELFFSVTGREIREKELEHWEEL